MYFDLTPEDGPKTYDTTYTDDLGNFTFDLPFEEAPPWLFRVELYKKDYVGQNYGALFPFFRFQSYLF